MKSTRIASILVIIIALTFILFYLREILIPFVLALIVWSLIRGVEAFVGKIRLAGMTPPRWLRAVLAFLFIFGILSLIVYFLSSNIKGVNEVLPKYQATLNNLKSELLARFGFDIGQQLNTYIENFDLALLIGKILNSLTSVLGNAFLVVIYVIFLMVEERHFQSKLSFFFRKNESKDKTLAILHQIDESLSRYVGLKTLVSFLTGILSYIALSIIGIDFAFFWAFLIFLLNFIPNIGSLIGTLFPALIAVLEFGDYKHALWVLLAVGSIQAVIGNVVEPKLMGNSLNVSALVVILALVFWGFLWGIVGMVLSVPIMVMLIIILSQFPATRGTAVLLSEKGKISDQVK